MRYTPMWIYAYGIACPFFVDSVYRSSTLGKSPSSAADPRSSGPETANAMERLLTFLLHLFSLPSIRASPPVPFAMTCLAMRTQ